jgi:hypothetical protein
MMPGQQQTNWTTLVELRFLRAKRLHRFCPPDRSQPEGSAIFFAGRTRGGGGES